MEAFDSVEADLLRGWRPALRGDPRTCDVQWLYKRVIPTLAPTATIVEVGTSWGRSVIFAAACCLDAAHVQAQLWAFDPFRGPGDPMKGASEMRYGEAAASWLAHATPAELQLIRFCRLASPAAALLFHPESIDLVMIDGCHERRAVEADIDAWFPRVKRGGILAGHDYTAEFPGVVGAVREVFRRDAAVLGSCWAVRRAQLTAVSPRVDRLGRR